MWIVMLIVIISQIIFTIWLCRKDKSFTTSSKAKHSMQNFLKNLKRNYWYSSDKNIVLIFEEIKGIATVKVRENGYYGKDRVYILQPTSNDRLATFDTVTGRFTIGITDNGEELFISPLGIFLYDSRTVDLKNEEAQSINPKESDSNVINV